MASSSASGIAADVYDIDCVPRFTDFTSPTLDHDETLGDKWFDLQEQQLSEQEQVVSVCDQDENIPPALEIVSNSLEPAENKSVTNLIVQEENEPPALQSKHESPKKAPLVENTRNASPAQKKNTAAATISSEQIQEKCKPPLPESKYKSPSLSSKPPVLGVARKTAEMAKTTAVGSNRPENTRKSSAPMKSTDGAIVQENIRKSPAPKKAIPSSSMPENMRKSPAFKRPIAGSNMPENMRKSPVPKKSVPTSTMPENMRKSPAPMKPVDGSSVQENIRKSPAPKKSIPSSSMPENMRKSPVLKKPLASSSVVEEKKPSVMRNALKSAEQPKKMSVGGSGMEESRERSRAPKKSILSTSTSVQDESKSSENGHKSLPLIKSQEDSRHSAIDDDKDKRCSIRRAVVPQAFNFATDERIKRRSVSRDAVRSTAGPATPTAERRLLPFMQGLRHYDKPTGSPARKPLTLPQPFHFHELKPREKKEDESHHQQQQPIIKGKPPVPPNATRLSRAPMRVVAPTRPPPDAETKEKDQPTVGLYQSKRTVRRSVSATNVRVDGMQPFIANCLGNGSSSLRTSLAGSTSSLNNGVLEKVEQGATHGLPVIAKDRSRSRHRKNRR